MSNADLGRLLREAFAIPDDRAKLAKLTKALSTPLRRKGMEWHLLGHGVFRLTLDGDEVARIRPFKTNETPVAGWVVTSEGLWYVPRDPQRDSLAEAWAYVRDLAAEHGVQTPPPLPAEAEAVDRVFRLGGGE